MPCLFVSANVWNYCDDFARLGPGACDDCRGNRFLQMLEPISWSAKDQDCELSASHVLLVRDVLIDGYNHIETCRFSCQEQSSVL